MNYTEFAGAVEKQISKRMEEGVTVSLYTAVKNNGKERTGVMIETPGINLSPTIYLEEYYENYCQGRSLDQIADEIVSFYDNIKREEPWDCEKIRSYQGVKHRIVFKLINTAKNRKFLSTVPHRRFLDLSIVFYVLFEATKEGMAAMAVSDSHARQWEVTADMLWADAVRNVKRLLPAEFVTMQSAIKNILREHGEQEGPGETENLLLRNTGAKDGMYVLSNRLGSYGAACIAYPHIMGMIGEILERDYYVLPSSVHEVVIVPCSEEFGVRELNEMVRDINQTEVAEEEVLSNHVYLYKRSTGTLCPGEILQTGGVMG